MAPKTNPEAKLRRREQAKTYSTFLWECTGKPKGCNRSLSPPIHRRTSQSPFPRKHYTSSPREWCGSQATSLTTKSGGSKKGKLGSPKARHCGAVVENSLQGIPQLLLLLSHFSRVQLCATPWTAAYQAPPSMGFSRQEYWSGLPLPSPEFLSSPVVKTLCSHCWGSQFNPWSEN